MRDIIKELYYQCCSIAIARSFIIGILYTGGVDYEAGPYYVNITKGNMSAALCINIINDTELENGELFMLRINTATPEIIPKYPVEAMVTIKDDECKNPQVLYNKMIMFTFCLATIYRSDSDIINLASLIRIMYVDIYNKYIHT